MIPLSRLPVLLFFALLALVAIPLGLSGAESPWAARLSVVAPVVLIVEFVVYFVLSMLTNPRISLPGIAAVSFGMVSIRFLGSLVAMMVGGLVVAQGTPAGEMLLGMWVGNPMSIFLQAVVVVIAFPHLMAEVAPEIVSREVRGKLVDSTETALPRTEDAQASGLMETSPSGGFIQVFSFEELSGVVRKSHGLEGFLVFNNEGLVVWRDLPIRLDIDELIARVGNGFSDLDRTSRSIGVGEVRRMHLETTEHLLHAAQLDENFGLLLVYNKQTSIPETYSRVAVVSRTVQEFLQWKYPGLPTLTPSEREVAV